MLRLLVLLLVASSAWAELKLPSDPIRIQANTGAVIRVETDADQLAWKVPAGVWADPDSLKTKRLVCTAGPGTYTITLVACTGDEGIVFKDITLIVGPPDPIPVPPPPVDDTLRDKFIAAFALDAGTRAEKVGWRTSLWAVYMAQADRIAAYPDSTTFAAALADLQAAVKGELKDTSPNPPEWKLYNLRRAIAAEVQAVMGDDGDAKLDAATKMKAKTLFLRIGKALEGIK